MLPKDLIPHLEKGDRTKEFLKMKLDINRATDPRWNAPGLIATMPSPPQWAQQGQPWGGTIISTTSGSGLAAGLIGGNQIVGQAAW